jgi:hypothetical protein
MYSNYLQCIARKPLKGANLASAVHVLQLFAMQLIESRWKESKLTRVDQVLDVLTKHRQETAERD